MGYFFNDEVLHRINGQVNNYNIHNGAMKIPMSQMSTWRKNQK